VAHTHSRLYTSHSALLPLTFKHSSHHRTEALYPDVEEIDVNYLWEEVRACFMSASVANRLPSRCFSSGPQRWNHWASYCQQALRLIERYDMELWITLPNSRSCTQCLVFSCQLWTTLPTVPILHTVCLVFTCLFLKRESSWQLYTALGICGFITEQWSGYSVGRNCTSDSNCHEENVSATDVNCLNSSSDCSKPHFVTKNNTSRLRVPSCVDHNNQLQTLVLAPVSEFISL
jgi:hypothetical protein